MSFSRRSRRKRREGTITAAEGQGETIITVPFSAREVDAVFADRVTPRPSCAPPALDEVKIVVTEARRDESVIKISWTVVEARKIKYTILG